MTATAEKRIASSRQFKKQAAKPLDTTRLLLYRVAIAAGFLLLWELVATTEIIDPFWISKPSAIIPGTVEFLSTADGWAAIGVTLYEALAGLLAAMVVGIALGYVLTRSRNLLLVLNPFIGVLNAVPRLAMIPLFIVWFGIGSPSKIVMVFVICLFIFLVNTISGIESVDKDLIVMARTLGASRRQLLRKIVIPSSLPWLLAALRISLGNAFGGAVVAEMIAGQGGLGFMMASAAGLLNLRDVFIAVIIVMVVAYVADVLLLKVEKRILRWRPSSLDSM